MVNYSLIHYVAIQKIRLFGVRVIGRDGVEGFSFGSVRKILGASLKIKRSLQVDFIRELESVGLLKIKSKKTILLI